MSVLDTTPSSFVMGSGEVLPIGIDVGPLLTSGQAVGSPTILVTDDTTGEAVSLVDLPFVSGTMVTQVIRGSELAVGHAYRVQLTFTADPSVTVWECRFQLTVE